MKNSSKILGDILNQEDTNKETKRIEKKKVETETTGSKMKSASSKHISDSTNSSPKLKVKISEK